MKFTSKIATYVDLLRERADQQSDRLAYTFLPDGEGEGVSLSFAQLDERARAIGAYLREQCDPGDRVLVLLPSGLAYLCAFWGCLYAGVVAVPAYPPGNKRHLPRLASVINDAGAKLVLSEVSIEEMVRAMGEVGDAFDQLQWCAYESVTDEWAEHWTPPDIGPSTLAYLQYTSGSTSAPKGVMLTHANVLCNQKVIEAGCHHDQNSTYVSWLPLFHDMGLVSALQATYLGARFVFMSPTAFIQRPLRWLQAIDRFSAHTSGGPNFAYEHCVGRIDEEQCQGLDLSSWRIAFNGAEPVQWKTIEQFQQKFARFGFRQDAFYPCYGLAEATVAVTGGERGRGPVVEVVDGESLRTGKVRRVSEDELGARHIVGCGYPWMGEEVVIVDPDSEQVCAEDEIGEVWVKGGSVGRGYWNNAQESERVFGAYLGRKGPYLRTGDLGFVTAGELYIAGRAKDMIVIRGRNYFPQDIEQSVQQCHAALQRQVGAAFAIEVDGHEQLVIAQEVERSHWRKVDKEELAGIVCSVIGEEFELTVHALALLKPGRIPKTSSGKVQRQACKEAFLQGQLEATETKVSHAYVAPQNPLQTALCSIWVKVIGVEQVGIEDNFFALGGDSIKAVRVANQLQQTLGATVYVVSIFEAPTVQALAAYLHREYAPEIMQVFPQLIGPGDETAQGDGPESSSAPRQPETMLPPLLPVAREQPLPLSFSQQRLWFLDQLDPGNPVYNIPAAMRMSGLLDMQALESCFEAIVARHEILRTRFAVVGTDPVQAIDPHAELVIEKHDFSQLEGSEQTQAVMGYIEEQARRGFRLDTDMLIRVSVLRLANDEHVLMVNMHHIVCDGWSIGVMVQELGMLYSSKVKAQDGVLPALPIQYGDYAVWQRGWLVGDELERQLNYWENQLRGAPVVLGIPTDRPRPPIKSYRGRHFTFKFSEFVTRKLRVFAQSQGVTLYVLLLTGYQLMLSRYARENDICVGTAVAGRSHAEVEGLIGFFVNALVMRTDVSGDPSVAQLLERVRDVVLGAFAHEAVPAELVVERLGVERNLSHAPLAQVALTLQNAPVGVVEVPGVRFEPISFETCTAQYDLMVLMEEVNNELIGTVEYSTDLFDESTVAQMMGHMENLLRGMVIDPERRLSDVSMLGTNELYELLNLPQQSYEQIWPLTTTQRDLYLHSVMVPDTVLNSMGVVLKLDATTDLVQWRAALETLYEQDPVLRAEIVSANIPFLDAAYLAIPCSPKTHFEVLDLRAEKLTQAQLKQRVDELVYAPYEIAKPPLIRHYVLQIDDENIYAVFAGHHIVMDGISGGLVVLHAYNIYQALGKGKTYSDCPPPVFERYQQEHNRQFDTPKVQEYWQQKLQNVEPLSCPHPVDYAGEYRHIQLDVEAIEWEAIRRFCRKNVITPAIFFRAVYGLLVRTMCRAEEDFVVNEVVSGRSKDYRQTFGCYYHQIPLVYEIEKMNANVRVDQYLTHMKSLLRSLKNMQYVSLFEQRKHQTESSIQFIYNYHLIDFPFPGRVILRRPPSGADQVQFLPEVQEGALQLNLYFHDGYFLGGGFLERLLDVSNQIVNGANYLGDLNYVTPSEHAKLLDWGAGICPLPPYKDAVVGFEDQVRRTPNAMAVEHGNIRISYQALNARANQLARYLLAQGVCSGDRVGIGLGLGVDLLVSVLAAYKVGAAYVPLDVRYPAQRLTFMAEQGQLRHLITAQQWSSLWQDTAVPISVIDHIEASLSNYAQTDLQGVERGGLAYIVFTSGSTGQPKGVGVEHHGVVNLLHWYGAEFGMGADDKHLVISSFGFDLTQKNLLAVLWRGGCVVFGEWEDYEPNRVAQLIEQAGITLLNCAPSMFYPLLEAKWYECLKSLRYVLLGGEPIALDRMRHWLGSELCRTELINLYGPTECTDIASFFRFTSVDLKYPTVSLGGPNWGMRLKVLDEALRMVPVGVVGELCIGGVGVSWGYINVADQTAERFVPDSFAGDGSRLYRTGDLVRYRPDGNLEYLGRMDDQVKVRGYRIELGEIEAVLGQCAGVAQAIAVIHKGEEDNHQLVAYIVWHSGEQGEFDTLRKALAEKLPAYMIPHAMVTLETIPLTPNGKIDRKALPDPQFQSDQQSYIAPRNPQEEELVGIFARILKLERVGVEDNFFALGGHSLLATQLISQIRDQFGIEIALRTVFEQPTVAGLAVEVIKAQQNEQNLKLPPLLRVPREGTLPVSFAQQRLWFLDQLDPGNAVYNMPAALRVSGQLDVQILSQSFNALLARHEILRTRFEVVDGEPVQIIDPSAKLVLDKKDFTALSEADQERQVQHYVQEQAALGFRLDSDMLIRVSVVKLKADEHVLMVNMHHIICDGWSIGVMVQELGILYAGAMSGRVSSLPVLPVQYVDYAVWQRKWLSGAELERQLGYWEDCLKDAPAVLGLPTDRPRPAVQNFQGAHFKFQISHSLTHRMREFAQAQGVTLYVFLLAAYKVMLARYSHEDDICVGTAAAGRSLAEVEGLIGFFVNALVIRSDVSGNPSIEQLLTRVHEVVLGAFAHEAVPAELVIERLGVDRNLGHAPIAQVAFTLQNAPVDVVEVPGIRFELMEFDTHTAKYDLMLMMEEVDEGLIGTVEYSTDLFDVATIARMMGHLENLLTEMVDDSQRRLTDLSMLGEGELYDILGVSEQEYQAIWTLTTTQRDLYLHSLLNPDTRLNTVGMIMELDQDADIDLWKEAFTRVLQGQPQLRSRFVECNKPYGEMVYAAIAREANIQFEVLDIRGYQYTEEELESWAMQLINQPFAIHGEGLGRHYIVKVNEGRMIGVVAGHHILADGIGGGLYLWEATQAYEKLRAGQQYVAEPSVFEQYVRDHRDRFDTTQVEQYWSQQLQGVQVLEIPRPSCEGQSCQEQVWLSEARWKQIRSYCRKHRLTPAIFFRAMYGLLLNAYCRPEEDFVVGEVVSGREEKAYRSSIGCFYHQIPLVFRKSSLAGSVADYYAQTKEQLRNLRGKQYVSVFMQRKLLGEMQLEFLYNYHQIHFPFTQTVRRYRPPAADQQVQFLPDVVDDRLSLNLYYHSGYFSGEGFIDRMLWIIDQLLAGAEQLDQLNYLLECEREQLSVWSAGSSRACDFEDAVSGFEAQVDKGPDALAVVAGEQRISYGDLNARANQLARYLVERGLRSGDRAGIALPLGIDLLVSVLAVYKVGGAYVPLDLSYPPERLQQMTEQAKVSLVISNDRWPTHNNATTLIDCSEFDSVLSAYEQTNIANVARGGLAYIVFTSGSTGLPKGVGVEHRGVVNLLHWYSSSFGLNADDKQLVISAFGFDLTQKNLLALLWCGGCLVFADQEEYDAQHLAQLIERESVSLLNCAPSMLYPLVESQIFQARLSSLRWVWLGGEPIGISRLNDWLKLPSCQAQLVNTYGPTECTDIASYYCLDEQWQKLTQVPLGVPNWGVNLWILDGDLDQVPVGVAGELCISGIGVSWGYINDAAFTAQRFVANPFGSGDRLYRTGDLARYRADGLLEYLGRLDDQVKLRGLRIELGEIETILIGLASVVQAKVLVKDENLVAYVVATREWDQVQVQAQLGVRLPAYMVPSIYVQLDTFPLTPNGKIDRKALLALTEVSAVEYVEPTTPVEKKLAALFCEVLGLERIGVLDNFFNMGGHSILATQLVSRVREAFAVEFELRQVFETPTLQSLAKKIENLLSDDGSCELLPLSYVQERLWFLDQFDASNTVYNLHEALRLSGPLEVGVLNKVLLKLLSRHESLRTNFIQRGGLPVRQIRESSSSRVNHKDFRLVDGNQKELVIEKHIQQVLSTPFLLSIDSLLRIDLLQLAREEWILILSTHQIICDERSLQIIVREMFDLYNAVQTGIAIELPLLTAQYSDYVRWQRDATQGNVFDSQLQFWVDKLSDAPLLELPLDRPRPSHQTFAGDHYQQLIGKPLSGRVKLLSEKSGASLFVTLFAAYQVLMLRLSGQEDFCIGTTTNAVRNKKKFADLVGNFTNVTVLRGDLSSNPSFATHLQNAQEVVLEALGHQEVPIENIIERLQPDRHLNKTPLFQVMFEFSNSTVSDCIVNVHPQLQAYPVAKRTARYELCLNVQERSDGLVLNWQYKTDLFAQETIRRLGAYYERLLCGVVVDVDSPIWSYELMSDVERHALMDNWSQKDTLYDIRAGLHDIIERRCQLEGDSVAVRSNSQSLSYRALSERSDHLSECLRKMGVGSEVLVAVCLDRSPDMVVSLLGVLKAGGAYVPLDPSDPPSRLAYILDDSKAQVLITQSKIVPQLPMHGARLFCVDEPWPQPSSALISCGFDPMQLANVVYTPGPTMKPKGVANTHRNLVNFLCAIADRPGMSASDVLLAMTPLASDIATLEVFLPLLAGARLEIADQEVLVDARALQRYALQRSVNIMQATPENWEKLCSVDWGAQSDLTILTGGEVLSKQAVDSLLAAGVRVWYLYGNAESTGWAAINELHADRPISFGRALPNTRIYILDAYGQLVPPGVTGEIYIGGVGLARGYLDCPGLTAATFIADPYSEDTGSRMYKTGDLAHWDSEGELHYVGRVDNQVHLHGHHIALDEIETAIAVNSEIQQAVIRVEQDLSNNSPVVAYVVPNENAKERISINSFIEQEQISHWRLKWNQCYDSAGQGSHGIGWLDTLVAEDVRQSLMEDTAQCISTIQAQRILELGCGSGALLSQVASSCEFYLGTDFSKSGLAQAQAYVDEHNITAVTLLQREAINFRGLQEHSFDCVVLNSIVEYFPSIDYLVSVIKSAVACVEPGGSIFIGNVLNNVFADIVPVAKVLDEASDSEDLEALLKRLRALPADEYLYVEPAFFEALQQHLPQISDVKILLKTSTHLNTVTKFCYDVIISTKAGSERSPQRKFSWSACKGDLATLQDKVKGLQSALISNIPNLRVAKDLLLLDMLSEQQFSGSVAMLREALAEHNNQVSSEPGDIVQAMRRLGFEVQLQWPKGGDRHYFDLMLYRA